MRVKQLSSGSDVDGEEIDDVPTGERLLEIDVPKRDHRDRIRDELTQLPRRRRALKAERLDRMSNVGAREGEGCRRTAGNGQIEVAHEAREANVILLFAVHVRKGPCVLALVLS